MAAHFPRSQFPRTAFTGAISSSFSITSRLPISPACIIRSTPFKACIASSRSRPRVSEIIPIVFIPGHPPTPSPCCLSANKYDWFSQPMSSSSFSKESCIIIRSIASGIFSKKKRYRHPSQASFGHIRNTIGRSSMYFLQIIWS